MSVTTVVTPAAASADNLTTVARVKEYANETTTDNDAKWTNLLAASSRAVEKYCDRLFLSDTYTEYLSGRGSPYLTTSAYPITALTSVFLLDRVLDITNTSSTTVYARVATGSAGRTVGYTRLSTSGGTATSTSTGYTAVATFNTIAANIIAMGSGWSAAVVGPYGYRQAEDLKTFQQPPQIDANNSVASLYAYVYDPGVCGVDEVTGTIRCSSCVPAKEKIAKVVYTGGYTTIPDDVQVAVCALAAALFRISARDSSLKSERIGDYSYTLADVNALAGRLPTVSPDAAMLLAAYKRPRML